MPMPDPDGSAAPAGAAPMIMIVDDDPAVRDSLSLLLRAAGYRTRTWASAEALLLALPVAADCLIADVRMPGGMDGITLVEELRRRELDLPAIVVTGHGDVPMAVRAMKAGAADFIEKPYDDTRILNLVAMALADAQRRRDPGRQDALRLLATLTPRENEVMLALVAGKPNKTIAYQLGISPRTVEVHRAHMMEKLGARSLSTVVKLALAAGIET